MCRLMAFSSCKTTSLPSFMGDSFQEFIQLSNVHHDSWGLALVESGKSTITKKVETAAASKEFNEVINSASGMGGLLHFRWATPGLPVTYNNAHPFSFQDISFIHNGALSPYDAVAYLVAPQFAALKTGDTDSEQFFLFVLTEIEKFGFVDGVKSAITTIKSDFQYSSINSMIMSSDFLVVTSEFDPAKIPSWAEPEYYELRYRLDSEGIAVASSGWDQEGWTLLQNHQMLIFNRSTLEVEIINL